jgi:iron complex outermembrane recepter protein
VKTRDGPSFPERRRSATRGIEGPSLVFALGTSGLTPVLFFVATAVSAQTTESVVVTATRVPHAGFDVPAAIDAVDARVIREDNAQVNLSEVLNRVPGIVVQNRQNYAQDLQISSRGFGARSTFGVRGIRLIADGIPATMPDGQGQAASFDLSSADRVEVLRGPFASLYGNSSGGVVQIFTADGPPKPTLDAGFLAGSYGQRRESVRFGGDTGGLNYIASASRFETDGYREHSAATREQLNAKLRAALGPGTLTLVVNGLNQPDTQDPLGLTRAQFEANPRQVDPSAIAFNTRKSIRQEQGGLVYEASPTSRDQAYARVYYGGRKVTQFLGQDGNTPLGAGGVVDLDRNYGGAGLRWSRLLIEGERPLTMSLGVDYDRLLEHRRGYVNNAGVQGALKRDEDDTVSNSDVYLQAEWNLSPYWSLSGGARRSTVRFDSVDHYIVGPNPDDSGNVSYARTTPVAGVMFKPDAAWHLYANAGQGFETPTFAELAYRPGGATGLNFALQPAKSNHYEAGIKARIAGNIRAAAAVFRIETRDEIVTDTNVGGRSTFKNASRTTRDGVEMSLEGKFAGGFEASAAYTVLDARFTEPFTSGTPPVAVPSGKKLPGVPGTVLYAEGVWRHAASGFHAAVELRYAGKVYVNEGNTDAAQAYTVANVRAGLEQGSGAWKLREFVRVDNVADRRYAGSVIVAEARGRYFEPAPGRNFIAGIEASFTF